MIEDALKNSQRLRPEDTLWLQISMQVCIFNLSVLAWHSWVAQNA